MASVLSVIYLYYLGRVYKIKKPSNKGPDRWPKWGGLLRASSTLWVIFKNIGCISIY